jgi:uncharacterized delta-60 repeat protein
MGSVDKTFGLRVGSNGQSATGYIENDFDGQDQPAALLIQPDGKIVVGGNSFRDNNSRFVFTRYTPVGLSDKSFDGDGKMSTKFTATGATLSGIALQADGKLIAAGNWNGQMTIVRYNVNGSVDTYFGEKGFVYANPSSGNDTITSVFALPTGKILTVGYMPGAPVVSQYLSTGQVDSSFGANGTATIYAGAIGANAAARMTDGRVVIAGVSGSSTALVRLVNAPTQVGIYPWVEGAGESADKPKSGAIIVGRDGVYNFPTRVWFTIGGNATPLADYGGDFALVQTSPAQGYVDIPAHQSFVLVPITVRDDDALEPTETATFTLKEDSAYSGGTGVFASVTIADNDSLNVNFQGPTPGTVGNYKPDRGEVFHDHLGIGYGWDADNSANGRNRGNRRSPDFRYDSLNQMQRNGANRKWEIAVPNGLYLVTLVAGDPDNTDAIYKMNLENKLALNGTPTGNTRWFMSTLNVQVNDGRLTLTNAGGARNNRVCFIDIQAAAPGATAGAVKLNAPIRLENPAPAVLRAQPRAFEPLVRGFFSDAAVKEAFLA